MNRTTPYELTEDHSYDGQVSAKKLADKLNGIIDYINDLESELRDLERGK